MAPASLQDHTEGGTTLLGFGLTCSPEGPLTGVSPTACYAAALPLQISAADAPAHEQSNVCPAPGTLMAPSSTRYVPPINYS